MVMVNGMPVLVHWPEKLLLTVNVPLYVPPAIIAGTVMGILLAGRDCKAHVYKILQYLLLRHM